MNNPEALSYPSPGSSDANGDPSDSGSSPVAGMSSRKSAAGSSSDDAAREDLAKRDEEDRGWVRETLGGGEAGRAAFERLYRRYRERAYRVAYAVVRHREDALEATQEVFVKVHQALETFDTRGRFVTWLCRIARNQAIDMLRRRGTRREQSWGEDSSGPIPQEAVSGLARDAAPGFTAAERTTPLGSTEVGSAEDLERSEVQRRIAAALDRLPEKHRTVFMLYSYEEMSYQEIADTLDVPLGTVMSRLFHARKKIKEQLPPDWDPGGARRREDRRRSKSDQESKS